MTSCQALLGLCLGGACLLAACERKAPATAERPPNCDAEKARLIQFVERLPEQAMSKELRVSLANSTLGGGLGAGPVLELSEGWVALDGVAIEGATHEATIENLKLRLDALAGPPVAGSAPPILYVAASHDTDVRTLQGYLRALEGRWVPKLLFSAPPLSRDASLGEHDLAARLFAERDVEKRRALAREAYAAYSSCDGVARVVASTEATGSERWPGLRRGMLAALPGCDCSELDADNLGSVLLAEQRSSGVAIGSLNVDFLADERCAAAMPLRSMQQVLEDVEVFQEEFSGEWRAGALEFEEVITSERLLVHLCPALPGETLASLQRAKRTVWFKTELGCRAMRFAPASPGAPMGTWQRLEAGAPGSVQLFYRQYAEDLRLFGPVVDPGSRPTDDGPWECSQDFHLSAVDEASIELEQGGRWFFTEAACARGTQADQLPPGCIYDLVSRP